MTDYPHIDKQTKHEMREGRRQAKRNSKPKKLGLPVDMGDLKSGDIPLTPHFQEKIDRSRMPQQVREAAERADAFFQPPKIGHVISELEKYVKGLAYAAAAMPFDKKTPYTSDDLSRAQGRAEVGVAMILALQSVDLGA